MITLFERGLGGASVGFARAQSAGTAFVLSIFRPDVAPFLWTIKTGLGGAALALKIAPVLAPMVGPPGGGSGDAAVKAFSGIEVGEVGYGLGPAAAPAAINCRLR